MSLLKKVMLAASLFLVSGFASAAVYNLDLTTGSDLSIVGATSTGLTIDIFEFSLSQDSFVSQDADYFGGFSNFGFSIFDASSNANLADAVMVNGVFKIDDLFLQAGNYVTAVSSVFDGGFGVYALATSVSPVPEASTIAMMLGGLGLVGFMARRRKVA